MSIHLFTNKETSGLDRELYRTLDFIAIDELREFAGAAIEEHGSVEKLTVANKVADTVRDLLTHKKLLDEHTHQSFVDVMMTAALLHNLFFDESDWLTLFLARKELKPIAEDMGINDQALGAIFHTIEGQLGDRTPIAEIIPKPGTPTELFAYAIWFVKYSK